MDAFLQLLVVKTGTTEPEVVAKHGDYDDWFSALFLKNGIQQTLCQAWKGEPLPCANRFDGILLTGSPASVRDESSWMKPLAEWSLRAAETAVPVLAVCFGHQLLGEALGGRIESNPEGPEYGTIEVSLSEAGQNDHLFEGIPSSFLAQSVHRDALQSPPAATLLASTPNTPWQAFGWGKHLRAVQFHPEIPSAALRSLCKVRNIQAPVRGFSHGPEILDNWIEFCLKSRFLGI